MNGSTTISGKWKDTVYKTKAKKSKPSSCAVIFVKKFLTGLSAGKSFIEVMACNSRDSANEYAKYLKAEKVLETELTNDLYEVKKVKVVSYTGAYGFDVLKSYKKFL